MQDAIYRRKKYRNVRPIVLYVVGVVLTTKSQVSLIILLADLSNNVKRSVPN